jgi:hypothetical protein
LTNPERFLESSSSRAKIQNFHDTFQELKNDFGRGATMQSAAINEKILHAIREVNFRSLLYARKAQFNCSMSNTQGTLT